MANVLFKRGQQATLDAQGFQAQDGVFYLTQDTNRLYIGEGNALKLLNQTVQIVSSLSELVTKSASWTTEAQRQAHRFDFYYVTNSSTDPASKGNILAVWDGTQWVQINPDTNTTVKTLAYGASATSNIATVTSTITDTAEADVSDSFTVTAAGGLTAAASGKNITLTGETYSLSRSVDDGHKSATITLDATLGTDSSINLAGGDNVTLVAVNNGIQINAQDTVNTTVDVTMPQDGQLHIVVNDDNSGEAEGTLSNIGVAIGAGSGNVGGNYLPITSTTGKTAANVYTSDEIDNLLAGLNGMTFLGTYNPDGTNSSGNINTLPTANVHNGDTYVITKAGITSISGVETSTTGSDTPGAIPGGTRVGDLLIARGTEVNGVIPSANLSWVYIPAGNDSAAAYTYTAHNDAATNTVELQNDLNATIIAHSLVAGTDVTISSVESSGSLTSTIAHATYNAVTPTAASSLSTRTSSFTAIKGITLSNGHVTAIETDTYTPVTYTLSGATTTQGTVFSASSSSNDVTASIALTDDASGDCGTGDIKFSSSSITLSPAANGEVVMDLVWGTF